MAALVAYAVLCLLVGGVAVWRWWRRMRTDRLRDRARLAAIEGQLATFRALLHLEVAEHLTRQKMTRRFPGGG